MKMNLEPRKQEDNKQDRKIDKNIRNNIIIELIRNQRNFRKLLNCQGDRKCG